METIQMVNKREMVKKYFIVSYYLGIKNIIHVLKIGL